MELMMLITADYASVDAGTGKLNILGAFSTITAREFPARHQRMALAIKLRAEIGDHHDERSLVVELVDEDGIPHMHISGPFQFPQVGGGGLGEFNAVLELNNVPFPHPGFYVFKVYADGVFLKDTTIELVQTDQQSE